MDAIEKILLDIKMLIERHSLFQKEILTAEEAAYYLGISKSTLYKLTSDNILPHYKPNNKKIYFKQSELNDWIMRSKISTKEEIEDLTTNYLISNRDD